MKKMSYYGYDNGDMAIAPKAGDGKIYKLVQLISILVIIVAVAVLIFGITGMISLGSTGTGLVCTVGVIGIGAFAALPWVRVLEALKAKRYRITAIVFLAISGVCIILWIICVWLIINLVNTAASGSIDSTGAVIDYAKDIIGTLNTIRAVIIVSIQLTVSSFIAKNVIKYNKTLIPYQVMSGVSQVYFDFFICLLLTAFTITQKGEFLISDTAEWLTKAWPYALLAISFILSIFSSVVFRRVDRRNMMKYAAGQLNDESENKTAVTPAETDATPVDEKLAKIKDLLDKGLISQEEYDKKREDIINSI
ncbi:MAG: SHOCT domain-containing protein [Clostridiales bacterium]|nr:SHOCT domain-containing protein [Clostridiales bacterium]